MNIQQSDCNALTEFGYPPATDCAKADQAQSHQRQACWFRGWGCDYRIASDSYPVNSKTTIKGSILPVRHSKGQRIIPSGCDRVGGLDPACIAAAIRPTRAAVAAEFGPTGPPGMIAEDDGVSVESFAVKPKPGDVSPLGWVLAVNKVAATALDELSSSANE